ncbi:hypothetical protein [Bacillus sp. S/N-304-OC-R1]|uniref:hypothetical protein n=1 Tax=Bacillus sp. S/N-304-OC-R1 TaxID=2758034 RepID=UPI001C8E87A6|nr:hypothetical protein [Bacillus sp. S/N-304-OC-R1]MBY0122278.1 hypothetical protein [Bacillus sp. S/N-304-OC-R1]
MTKERELEVLVEALIRMLGKSNEKVNDLADRVNQLEVMLRESLFLVHYSIEETEQKANFSKYPS